MRPTLILAAAAVLIGLASAAAAQTSTSKMAPSPADSSAAPLPGAPDMEADAKLAAENTARLAQLDARIESDEVILTSLRDRELAAENARIKAIKPALPFHGSFLPRWL